MNANELAEDLEGAKLVILRLNEMLRQKQAEIEALKKQCALLQAGYNAQAILLGAENVELLETEIFVKGAVLKSYKEALEQIATGEIAGESTNYKDTVYVMRQIASDALAILRKASEK